VELLPVFRSRTFSQRVTLSWNPSAPETEMGCGGSKDVGEPAFEGPSNESKEMDEELQRQNKEENKIVKLLVLGTGESGKSTVFKQMKILYSVPDPPTKFIMVVRANLFGNAHAVHHGMEKLGIKYATPEGDAAGQLILSKPADGNTDVDCCLAAFKTMYEDAGVQESVERAAEYQLNDSTRYFWDRADEILKADYLPTEQDVLRARVRTTGIVQQNFQIGANRYTMFDVGGQRNERRKWIHCFDNVTAVIFVTAISEYDQVLYEDENTNRMDEATTLFDQICNHPSFKKTSMILFLNKRDLFEKKLVKKDLTCWDPACDAGHDYNKAIEYIKKKFINLNKEPENRQVYSHATCATDTSNIAFVMESVFDIILKENLRKMDMADVDKLMDSGNATGTSSIKFPAPYGKGSIVLCACNIVDTLQTREVLVDACGDRLPSVEIMEGKLSKDSADWIWLMGLGKSMPALPTARGELGTFQGNLKDAARKLREVLGLSETGEIGMIYDTPIVMESSGTTLIVCVQSHQSPSPFGGILKTSWKNFEAFEDACYSKFAGKSEPNAPPAKGEEFDPFAPNPVGHRWFKGICLYTAQVNAAPAKGVYLGIFRVLSSPSGFQVMVNEHNRNMIPLIFLTETQLTSAEKKWMHGVRLRWSRKVPLLEGKAPNRGWLGPEMSGEEGATFAEKLWWAIDEAKARLSATSLGDFYDAEVMDVDENDNIQMVMFASMAKDSADILPGHVWVDRMELEVQNMKCMCPKTLGSLLNEQNQLMTKYIALSSKAAEGGDMENMAQVRRDKDKLKLQIEDMLKSQTPLKWVNRVIMWVADKMPSFTTAVEGSADMEINALVDKALANNSQINHSQTQRAALIKKYCK